METVPVKNTAMPAAPVAKAVEQEFHFSGSGVYQPLTVKAPSRVEAQAKWEAQRIPYTQPSPTPAPAEVAA